MAAPAETYFSRSGRQAAGSGQAAVNVTAETTNPSGRGAGKKHFGLLKPTSVFASVWSERLAPLVTRRSVIEGDERCLEVDVTALSWEQFRLLARVLGPPVDAGHLASAERLPIPRGEFLKIVEAPEL